MHEGEGKEVIESWQTTEELSDLQGSCPEVGSAEVRGVIRQPKRGSAVCGAARQSGHVEESAQPTEWSGGMSSNPISVETRYCDVVYGGGAAIWSNLSLLLDVG